MAPFYGWKQLSQGYRATTRRCLIFTNKSPGVPGTHLINFGSMQGLVNRLAPQWF